MAATKAKEKLKKYWGDEIKNYSIKIKDETNGFTQTVINTMAKLFLIKK
jgi:cytoplasmic iron level regulating protein YaaA (DUF328/UPF0246 family)